MMNARATNTNDSVMMSGLVSNDGSSVLCVKVSTVETQGVDKNGSLYCVADANKFLFGCVNDCCEWHWCEVLKSVCYKMQGVVVVV